MRLSRKAVPFLVVISALPLTAQLSLSPYQGTALRSANRPRQATDGRGRESLVKSYHAAPLSFEVNQGQTDPRIKFIARGGGCTIFLTENEAVLGLARVDSPKPLNVSPEKDSARGRSSEKIQTAIIRMSLIGGATHAGIVAGKPLPAKANYLIGNNPSHWQTNIPVFGEITYRNVYSGVDLKYYGMQEQLEFDFIVAPGTDPYAILMQFEGVNGVELDSNGDAWLETDLGKMRLLKPVMYQDIQGKRHSVNGRYHARGTAQLGFELDAYDSNHSLVIDPVLSYATYLGGGGNDDANDIVVDTIGNAYVVGRTTSVNFPRLNPFQSIAPGGVNEDGERYYDAFVTKFNAAGDGLVYSTYLGGSLEDHGTGIAIDDGGHAYITGSTYSTDFPTANAIQPSWGGGAPRSGRPYLDAFVTKLSPAGNSLIYSTYLGGNNDDLGNAIIVDIEGNVYITGSTKSPNLPVFSAWQTTLRGVSDGFLAKINAAGSAFVFSSYLGGTQDDWCVDVALDNQGNSYVAGNTTSSDFPAVNALQPTYGGAGITGGGDGFVTKFNSSGTDVVFSTYLGGNDSDSVASIAVDGWGKVYVSGSTYSTNFPTVNSVQPVLGGNADAFIASIVEAGNAFDFSTYLGGSDNDNASAVAIDPSGDVYVTGITTSANFPELNPLQSSPTISYADGFIAKLVAGTSLAYSTRFGGNGHDFPYGLAVDSSGSAYISGATSSTDFIRANSFQPNFGGGWLIPYDAFVVKVLSVDGYDITGRISDTGGNPISGVTVALSGSQIGSEQTDASGHYSFVNLAPAGNFTITPSKQYHTFSPTFQSFSSLADDQTFDFVGTSFNVTISGRVVNANDVGVGGITMTLSGSQSSTIQTDSSGNYSFSGLPAGGTYRVAPSRGSDTFNPASQTFNNLGSDQTVDFTLVYQISGRVLDGGGVGMSGVNVNLSGFQMATSVTDTAGNYSFLNLPANGNYTVTPVKPGYTLTYTFSPASRAYSNLTANQTGDFTLVGTSTTIALNLTADAYVEDGSSASTNFGAVESLKIQTRNQGPNRDTFFKVDLTSITRKITSAKLNIYAATTGSNSLATSAYPVSDTVWIESGTGAITWNNKPARGSTAISGATVTVSGSAYSTYSLDVTSYVKSEKAAGRNVVSIALHNPSSSTLAILLNSREALTNKPQLVITTSDDNNASPTINLTSPTNGTSYVAPASIALVVTATDSDGSITKVDFYSGTTLLGTNTQPDSSTSNRYTFNWTNVSFGSYSLTAVASDDGGSTMAAQPVAVAVAPPNVPPTATLTSPITGSTYSDGSSVALTATASDLDGSISRVEFFDGSTLIGTAISPSGPGIYSVIWPNASAGVHSLTAKATDSSLGTATSAAVTVNIVRQAGLSPTADAYVADGSSASTNFGTAVDLQVQTSSGASITKEAYLKFDLSTVSGITRARLRVNGTSTSGSDVPTNVYSVSSTGWTETGITWNNRPLSSAVALAMATIRNSSQAWYEVDITGFIQTEKAAGRNTVSLVLKSATVGSCTFGSREAGSGRPQLLIETTSAKAALLIGGSNSPSSSDSAVQSRLQALGYTVTYRRDNSSATSNADGKTVVLISASVSPGLVNTKFRHVPIPVINWEADVFDDLGMTGTAAGTDFGTATGQTQININMPSHPMAAGLSGLNTVVNASSSFSWAKPNGHAATIAALSADAMKSLLFAYDGAVPMPGLNAPSRRVGLFLSDTTASSLNSNGWALFDAAVKWAVEISITPVITSLTPQIGLPGTAVTIAGSNFGSSQGSGTLTFAGVPVSPTSWSPTSIVAAVPSGATTGPVVVTLSGVSSNGMVFTVGEADTDADGLADSWEMFFFGNLGQTASGDPDGDGQTNLIEYLQGRSPTAVEVPDTNNAINLKVFTPLD
ncbi:MAG: DNRLRE domain-containing protein [Acidobacteriota bacterium]